MAKKTESPDQNSSSLKRLKKVEGQIRGVIGMVEDDRYCIDILNQLKAVKAAIVKVEKEILESHLHHCVHSAFEGQNKTKSLEMIDEIKSLFR